MGGSEPRVQRRDGFAERAVLVTMPVGRVARPWIHVLPRETKQMRRPVRLGTRRPQGSARLLRRSAQAGIQERDHECFRLEVESVAEYIITDHFHKDHGLLDSLERCRESGIQFAKKAVRTAAQSRSARASHPRDGSRETHGGDRPQTAERVASTIPKLATGVQTSYLNSRQGMTACRVGSGVTVSTRRIAYAGGKNAVTNWMRKLGTLALAGAVLALGCSDEGAPEPVTIVGAGGTDGMSAIGGTGAQGNGGSQLIATGGTGGVVVAMSTTIRPF